MLKWILILSGTLSFAHGALPSAARLQKELADKMERLKKTILNVRSLERDLRDTSEGTFSRVYEDIASVAEGRLTTVTATPVTTSAQTNVSTIYYTPYSGSCVSLFNGTNWTLYRFTERALALSGLTSGKNYDVFLYHNGTTLALELSAAWNTDVARTDAISLQNGIYVKTTATTRRYLGTFRATAATQTQDSLTQRFIWNYQNRLRRYMVVTDAANSWAYSTDSWRSADNTTANRVEFVIGLADEMVTGKALSLGQSNTVAFDYFASGMGLDSVTVDSAALKGGGSYIGANTGVISQAWSYYSGYPSIGYHFIQWLERANTTGVTFYGDNNAPAVYQAGMYVELDG